MAFSVKLSGSLLVYCGISDEHVGTKQNLEIQGKVAIIILYLYHAKEAHTWDKPRLCIIVLNYSG